MISILIVQAISFTPAFNASCMSTSRESTFLRPIVWRINLAPKPPIFILDNGSFRVPCGIIIPNILSSPFFFTAEASPLRNTFSPQKVKNIVTCLPIAAAPEAMIKEAIVLSRSPLNTIIVVPSLSADTGIEGFPPV
ncbi:hypothetical protein D3C74_427330 [compost metagenome]